MNHNTETTHIMRAYEIGESGHTCIVCNEVMNADDTVVLCDTSDSVVHMGCHYE